MKTRAELLRVLQSAPLSRVNAHVHTHLCDGKPEMTVANIAKVAEQSDLAVIVLTPHYHKRVSDATETLYEDSSPDMLLALREEITAYEKAGGGVCFLLSTEADILNMDGDIAFPASREAERALDCVTPTFNYHPLLPLRAVHVTYGRDINALHESGAYARMAQEAGGVARVLEGMYAAEANALLRAPCPALLGHFFAAHAMGERFNWFGIAEKHLPLLEAGAARVLDACASTGAMVDVTGLHARGLTPPEKRAQDGFLHGFQQRFLARCRARGVAYFPGTDAHALAGVSDMDVYRAYFC